MCMAFRKPKPDELRLLKELASIAGMETPHEWLNALQVQEMDDGGMGSLELVVQGPTPVRGQSGSVTCKAAVQFTDEDGVEVVASLNTGEGGVPFELDIWKTDFSPLIRIPDAFRRVVE
jgi:hypothetical protein